MPSQTDIRREITAKIIEALKEGNLPPWRKPWVADPNAGFPMNLVSKRSYSGINPLLLEITSMKRGYLSRWWGTFRQWSELGCQVKKRPANVPSGQWGTKVVLFKPIAKKRATEDNQEGKEAFLVLREYTLFNAQQVDGEAAEKCQVQSHRASAPVNFQPAEETIAATGARVLYGGNKAFYDRDNDSIRLPPRSKFGSAKDLYATTFHELSHWTGHPSRLDRTFGVFGSKRYAFEELIAEISGCYLCSELGIPQSALMDNHFAYLAEWLQTLQNDHRAIFRASSQASKAADFILDLSRNSTSQPATA